MRGEAATGPADRRSETLVERERELAVLSSLLSDAARGVGRVAAIEGEPGVGKTRLLDELCLNATNGGMRVLRARAGSTEEDFPFGVVRQLFEPAVAAAGPEERERLLGGAARLAEPVVSGVVSDSSNPGLELGYPVLHGLYWLCVNLAASAPLLLAVDDAQWIDNPSARSLAFISRRVEGLAASLVLACRAPAASTLPEVLTEALAEPATRSLRPRPLSRAGTERIVRAKLADQPDPAFAAACHEASGGNPFLLGELIADLVGAGVAPTAEGALAVPEARPFSIDRSVVVRLARLPPAATAVAEALAILGRGAPVARVAVLAGVDEAAMEGTLESLAGAGILAGPESLEFAHPLLGAAVGARLTRTELAARHAEAARLLRDEGATPTAVAVHLLHAGPRAQVWVVDVLRAAAQRALEDGAPETALAYLRRALSEPPDPEARPGLLLELGANEARSGARGAIEHLREAALSAGDAAVASTAALELAWALVGAGQIPEAVRMLDRALGSADGELARRLEVELIGSAWMDLSTRPIASRRLARLALPPEPHSAIDGALLANFTQQSAMEGSSAARSAALAERALAGAWLEGPENSGVFYMAVNTLLFADRFELASRALDRILDDARRRGFRLQSAIASTYRSLLGYRLGLLDDAVADARHALDVDHFLRSRLNRPAASAFLTYSLIEQGSLGEAESALGEAGLGSELPESFLVNAFLFARGSLRLAQGSHQEALGDLLECGRRLDAWGVINPAFIAWRSSTALALVALGDRAEAERLAGEEVALARRWGAPRALGVALRAAGLVAGGERGIGLLRDAADTLADSPALLERAKALVELGTALAGSGERGEARERLRLGQDLAQRCGATALAERARRELIAAGGRLRRPAVSGHAALTPSERRTARLAASGMTNREVAEALFLTEKTVETHLTNAYRKLGIASRAELEHALAGGAPRARRTP